MLTVGAFAAAWGWCNTQAADPIQPATTTTEKATDPVRALQKERLAAFQAILDVTRGQHETGRATAMEVEAAHSDVLRARLEITESPNERVAICEEAVKSAESRVRMSQAHLDGGHGDPTDVLRTKVSLLDARIALEREKAAVH